MAGQFIVIINPNLPFITTHHTLLFFPEGSLSFSLPLPWGIGRAGRRSCWRTAFLLLCSKPRVLDKIILRSLGGERKGLWLGRQESLDFCVPGFWDYSGEREEPPLSTLIEFPASCNNRGLELDLIGVLKMWYFSNHPSLWSNIYREKPQSVLEKNIIPSDLSDGRVMIERIDLKSVNFIAIGESDFFPQASKKRQRNRRCTKKQNMILLEKSAFLR